MHKVVAGGIIAVLVGLGYLFFRYEHRCPTPAELDKLLGDVRSGKLPPGNAEDAAKELDRRGCGAEARLVRDEVKKRTANQGPGTGPGTFTPPPPEKPSCPSYFNGLPDAPMRRGKEPAGPPPYGVTSIRNWAKSSIGLDSVVRNSHAEILEKEAPFWKPEGLESTFNQVARCLRGLPPAVVAGLGYKKDARRVGAWRM